MSIENKIEKFLVTEEKTPNAAYYVTFLQNAVKSLINVKQDLKKVATETKNVKVEGDTDLVKHWTAVSTQIKEIEKLLHG